MFRWTNGKNPLQNRFDFGLWIRAIVRELILKKFAVRLCNSCVGSLLTELNLTAQEPLWRAYQRNPQAMQRWQRKTYSALAARAEKQKAEINFWDESVFRTDALDGKAWAVRCKAPVVKRPQQLLSITAASAVNSRGAFWFATHEGGLTGAIFVDLLEALMCRCRKSLYLLVDGLPAHKSKIVED